MEKTNNFKSFEDVYNDMSLENLVYSCNYCKQTARRNALTVIERISSEAYHTICDGLQNVEVTETPGRVSYLRWNFKPTPETICSNFITVLVDVMDAEPAKVAEVKVETSFGTFYNCTYSAQDHNTISSPKYREMMDKILKDAKNRQLTKFKIMETVKYKSSEAELLMIHESSTLI